MDIERAHKNKISKMCLIGNVNGKDVLIFDDIGDTFSTISEAAIILKQKGARKITALIIHNVFSERAINNLLSSPINTLISTNSIPYSSKLKEVTDIKSGFKHIIIDISKFLGERIHILSELC